MEEIAENVALGFLSANHHDACGIQQHNRGAGTTSENWTVESADYEVFCYKSWHPHRIYVSWDRAGKKVHLKLRFLNLGKVTLNPLNQQCEYKLKSATMS